MSLIPPELPPKDKLPVKPTRIRVRPPLVAPPPSLISTESSSTRARATSTDCPPKPAIQSRPPIKRVPVPRYSNTLSSNEPKQEPEHACCNCHCHNVAERAAFSFPNLDFLLPKSTESSEASESICLNGSESMSDRWRKLVKQCTHKNKKGKKSYIRRNWWWLTLCGIIFIVASALYMHYQDDINKGTKGMRTWLENRQVWSWLMPTILLTVLCFPPAIGAEVVQFVVGLTYPLWLSVTIAAVSTIIGEALVFLIFKYAASGWVLRKCQASKGWAAIGRVSEESGFRGILVIRYSIIPPHLANPIFATMGVRFWVYMVTVVLSLPKQILVAFLGYQGAEHNKTMIALKVLAIVFLVLVTIWGTWWLKGELRIAKDAIRAERDNAVMAEVKKWTKNGDRIKSEERTSALV